MIPNEHTNPTDGEPAPEGAKQQRRRLVSRRALVRAGWTVPVVLALHLPPNALAEYACTHSDVPATAHTDVDGTAHSDATVDGEHADVPATLHEDVAGTAHLDACA